jgi:hypothetical protein
MSRPWSCGSHAVIPADVVAAAIDAREYYVLPAYSVILVNLPTPTFGVVLYRRVGPRWSGTLLAEGSEISGVFYSPDLKRFALAQSWISEGPSGQLVIVTGQIDPWRIHCTSLQLGRGRWLEDLQFNADSSGSGMLLGTLLFESARPARAFAMSTPDFGRTWAGFNNAPPAATLTGAFTALRKASDRQLADRFKRELGN